LGTYAYPYIIGRGRTGGSGFPPEQVAAMIAAFENCLERLKVEDRSSAMGFLVAKTIIQLAKEGERDRKRLCESVIRLYRQPPI
jgi:hypothetical protein